MNLKGKRIGFAMTGSFCTFDRALAQAEKLAMTGCRITPIMSETSYTTDTRFGTAAGFSQKLSEIAGQSVLSSISQTEPIGPKRLLDLLVILPCTGNTLAKLASGVTDTSVTMAAKAHLRNERPVLIGVSTNDGLGNAAKNIGSLLNFKNIFFIPFTQDDPVKKTRSTVADFELLIPAAEAALDNIQLQPIMGC